MIWVPNGKPVQQKMRDVVECDVWDRVLLVFCKPRHLRLAERFSEPTLELLLRSDCAEVPCDGDEVGELHLGVHGICEGQYAAGLRLDA